MSFSYRPELARAIAVTLTEPGHEGKVYDIITPPVTMRSWPRSPPGVTGRTYRYEPASDADWEATVAGAGPDGLGARSRSQLLRRSAGLR